MFKIDYRIIETQYPEESKGYAEKFVKKYFENHGYLVLSVREYRLISSLTDQHPSGNIIALHWKETIKKIQKVLKEGKIHFEELRDLDPDGFYPAEKRVEYYRSKYYKKDKLGSPIVEDIKLTGSLKENLNKLLEHCQVSLMPLVACQNYLSKKEKYNDFQEVVNFNPTLDFKSKGSPDLFAINDQDFFFVEVKGWNDSIKEDQIRWIMNAEKRGFKTVVLMVIKA